MKNSPHHRNHLKTKAIREANALQDSGPLPQDMIENKEFKNQFLAKEEKLPHKISKKRKQIAKRSSTKVVTQETEPDSIHQEGPRWQQVLKAQTKEKNLLLGKKMSKQRTKK